MSARIPILFALVIAAILGLAPAVGHAQIPNAGFETWTAGNPDNWVTSNIAQFVIPVTQSGTAHSGSSSMKGTVTAFYTSLIQPVVQSGPGGHGFAYTGRPASFKGWYQFYPVGGDRLAINTWTYLGGVNGTPIAVAAQAISAGAPAWTQFDVPFAYQSASNPDTCIIQLQIVGPTTGTDLHAGSYMLIDDLSFGSTTGVDDPPAPPPVTGLLESGPNPVTRSTSIAFALSRGGAVSLKVYDLEGRVVATLLDRTLEPGRHATAWNAGGEPSGVYWCRLVADGVTVSRKLVRMN
jgi:hypothetical protein